MEYKFASTVNGPVVVGEDEVLFFQQYGPLQDYIDSDPEFFTKAYEFFQVNMREQADQIIKSMTEQVMDLDWMNSFHQFYGAAKSLKEYERSLKSTHQH